MSEILTNALKHPWILFSLIAAPYIAYKVLSNPAFGNAYVIQNENRKRAILLNQLDTLNRIAFNTNKDKQQFVMRPLA